LLVHGTGQEPCPMMALAPAVLGRHLGSTNSVYCITHMVISPSSLLFPSSPTSPPLVPIVNKRIKVYVMKQVITEFTRESYQQDNSLTVPIVLYLYVCFTAGCAKRSSWPTKCGVDTASANPWARGYRGSGASQTYRILKFVLRSFGPDSLLLTEGSTLRDLAINMLIII
jgi:hypothetical protein